MRFSYLALVLLFTSGLAMPGPVVRAEDPPPKEGSAPLTAEQTAQLKERDALIQLVEKLRGQDKYSDALVPAVKALTLTRAVCGAAHAEVALSLTRLAEVQELADDWKAAAKSRQDVLDLRTKLDGEKHWRTADARLALAFTNKVVGLKEADRAKVVKALHSEQQAIRLEMQGKSADAERLALEVVEVYKTTLDAQTAAVARVWHLVGRVRLQRNDATGAKQANEQALAIRRKVLPKDHPDQGRSLNNLGLAEKGLKHFPEACELLKEAVKVWRASLGDTDPLLVMGLNNLGGVQDDLRDYAGAKQSYQEALAIRRKALPKDHPDIAQSLYNLGLVQQELQDLAAAKLSYGEALAIRRKALPKDHPVIARSLINLGFVQQELRDYVEAKQSYEEALAINRKIHPKNHPLIAATLNLLGSVQLNLGEYAAAKLSFEEALAIHRKTLPKDHPNIAQSIFNLGVVQQELRDFAAAKQSHAEALAIRRKVLPKDHPVLAQSLTMLGSVQLNLGEYAAAKLSFEEALAIRRKALPKDDPDIAISLTGLGEVQRKMRDYAAAKQSHEEALAIQRKALPKDHPDIAQSLNNLGTVQHDLRDYAAAKQSYEEALAIYRKALPKDHRDIANTLTNLSRVQNELRDYAVAKQSLEEALAIYRKALPKDHPDIAQSLNNLGAAQYRLRDYEAAKQSYEEALAIRRKALPNDHPDIAHSLNDLGVVQHDLRNYAAAKQRHEEALAIGRKTLPKDHPDIATSLNNLGLVQVDLCEYATAKQSLDEALAIRRKALPNDHPDIADSLENLGMLQASQRDYTAAKQNYEEALAIYRKTFPKDHPRIAISLTTLGLLQLDLHDCAAAKQNLDEALAIRRKALPNDHPAIADSLSNLGTLQVSQRDYTAAKQNYEEALAIYRKTPKDHPRIAICLNNLGALFAFTQNDPRTAVALLAEAVDIKQQNLSRLALAQAESEQLRAANEARSSLSVLLTVLPRTCNEQHDLAYTSVLAMKGAVTARQRWARTNRDLSDPVSVDLIRKLRQTDLELVGAATRHHPPKRYPEDITTILERLTAERVRLEQMLAARSPAYQEFLAQSRFDVNDVRAALPKGTVLVDFVQYYHVTPTQGKEVVSVEQRLVAFVIRSEQKEVVVVPLKSSEDLAKWIERWRASYGSGKKPPAGDPDPAAELRKCIWEPLAKHVEGAQVVLISPDGPLNGLPLAALPGAKEGTFLIHEHAFAIVPVPQLLPVLLRKNPRPGKEPPTLLLAGGIDFGEGKARDPEARPGQLPPVPVFKPLRGTESEVNDLRAQFEDAFPDAPAPKVLRKDKATKQTILAAAPTHRFVHLATHGFFAAESEKSALTTASRASLLRGEGWLHAEVTGRHPGLLSGLVFAGVNLPERRPEETILTALEVGELGLDKVELVVLSACETGRGQVAGGEGVLGLQRSFQLTGARSVAASLWSVPDEETHQLMREFYRRVWSDKPVSKAEALRQAQLWMLENWKPRTGLERPSPKGPPPPYVWAAFVLSGDWR